MTSEIASFIKSETKTTSYGPLNKVLCFESKEQKYRLRNVNRAYSRQVKKKIVTLEFSNDFLLLTSYNRSKAETIKVISNQ